MSNNIAVKQRRPLPQRTCVSCRKVMEKRRLTRVVRTPDGMVEVDPRGKISGRGAYLCSDYQCWQTAIGTRRLARALKCTISPRSLEAFKEYAKMLRPEVPVASKN